VRLDASQDAPADAIVAQDVRLTDAGTYARTGWTAVAVPDAVPMGSRVPASTETLATGDAFDGNNGTRWATGVYQDTLTASFPLTFTVDMKQVLTVSKITLYAGSQDLLDYPMTMDVSVSLDGTFGGTPVVMGHAPMPPGSGIDPITFPAPQAARYIRLSATKGQPTSNRRWWAIGEMNVYP
jgi:hypothetical protein